MTDRGDLGYSAAAYPAIEGFMFDVDGTLLLGDRSLGSYEVLPGAIEVLTALKERSVPFALLTNGSAYPPQEQAARLRAVGLPVEDSQMITPSSVTVEQMSRLGTKRVLVLGTRGVGQSLLESGIQTVYTGEPDASQVDAVYVGCVTTLEEWLLQPTMRRPHRVLGDLRDLLSDATRMS